MESYAYRLCLRALREYRERGGLKSLERPGKSTRGKLSDPAVNGTSPSPRKENLTERRGMLNIAKGA